MTFSSILIVDDIEANRLTLEDLLECPEFQLHFAADGATALAKAAELQPDLILLDVMMPGIDGFEVCSRLRASPQLAEIPILMVTALEDRASRLHGIKSGADDFVTKPFDRTELRARVRGILRLNRYRRLQEATERIREQAALIDLSPDAVIVCDLHQRITHWNPAAERLYGWSAGEAIGQRADVLLAAGDEAQTCEPFANDVWRVEATQITREETAIVVDSRGKLLRDAAGKPKAVLIINTDLTEKKQLEVQFLRAQRLESIGTLASGIAHDLNNVLSPILMSIELLRMRIHDQDAELLDTLETSAHRGADLIRQILGFARGTGTEKSELQLGHLLQAIGKMLRGTFPKNIGIQTKVPGGTWPVLGSPTQLDQVLMNLCVNARDAMPGGGELQVTLENVTVTDSDCENHPAGRPGPHVCITVADTGMGMPPEVVARIFDAFFTTKGEGKGTGLGLATVQTIVAGHGGFLTVDSKVGSGTRFKVYLPAIPNLAATDFDTTRSTGFPRGNGECILVADDEAGILETTTATLERYGYRTLKAMDGLQALEQFTQHRMSIQMIITDTEMPQIGGSALTQIVRELDPQLPILLVSGAQADEKIMANGHNIEFLKKPFDTAELLQTIQRSLASAPGCQA